MTVHYTDPFGPPWKVPWLKMMSQWQGSIFQFIWVEFVIAMSLFAIVLSLWYVSLKDSPADVTPEQEAVFQTLGFVTSRFQAAISLMLGFYTSTLYTRWWKVRDVEGVVIGRINDLAVQIAALVRDRPMGDTKGDNEGIMSRKVSEDSLSGDQGHTLGLASSKTPEPPTRTDPKKSPGTLDGMGVATANEVRMNLVRWLNLAHALTVGDLYERQPNEFTSLEDLLDFGLLTPHEYEYMKTNARSRYQVPFVWFLNLLHELKDEGYCGISDGTMIIFCENCTRIRGSLADLYMYRNVPVPLSYRQLVNWTVRGYMVIFAVAGALGSILTDDGNLGGLTTSVFFLLVPFAFEYFMFVGWLSLADALGNPFRAWADEFEYENYVKGVALGSNLCITTARDACTPLEEVESISKSVEKKQAATLSRWEDSASDHESLRERLTGLRF